MKDRVCLFKEKLHPLHENQTLTLKFLTLSTCETDNDACLPNQLDQTIVIKMQLLRLAQTFSRYYYPAFSQRHCVLFTLKIQESPLLFRFQSCFVAIRRLLGICLAKQVVVVCLYTTYTVHIFLSDSKLSSGKFLSLPF